MGQLTREHMVSEALDLLDEVGLDQVTTRALAQRLGIKQPSLYWHFTSKDELLTAMAAAAMAPHAQFPLPVPSDDWRAWFMDNYSSFRQTLLLHRDGAKLHAGSRPAGEGLERTAAKVDFLVAAGLPRVSAEAAMLAASRFTVGSVLEQQADAERAPNEMPIDHDQAFRAGLGLIIEGLAQQG